jgi:hypothetical protein
MPENSLRTGNIRRKIDDFRRYRGTQDYILDKSRTPGAGARERLRDSVAMQLRIHPDHLHLAPAVGLALRMTAAQARRIGRLLQKKADEAEEGLPRA